MNKLLFLLALFIFGATELHRLLWEVNAQSQQHQNVFLDVTDYGAMCDGMTDDTVPMQHIFHTIIPMKRRGGSTFRITVIVPQQCILQCGPLNIESTSGITLQIDGRLQALDIASNNYSQLDMWPMIEPLITYGNSRDVHGLYYQYQPFIYLNNVSNVRITGNGVIDGFGQPWWDIVTSRNQSIYNLLSAGRPNLIQIVNSSLLEIDTITLTNSPFWTLHPVLSQYIHIHHITISAPLYSPNVDGIDPEYVHICHRFLLHGSLYVLYNINSIIFLTFDVFGPYLHSHSCKFLSARPN